MSPKHRTQEMLHLSSVFQFHISDLCRRWKQHNNSEIIFIIHEPNRRKHNGKIRSENTPIPCPPCPPANRSIVPSILSACHLPVPVNKWPVFHPLKSARCHSTEKHYISTRFAGHHPQFLQSLTIQGVRFNCSTTRAYKNSIKEQLYRSLN